MEKQRRNVRRISGKKGALAPGVIVGTLLVLVGFFLVSYLFYSSISKPDFDRETCKQSAVFRASLPSEKNIQRNIPLKCQTRKVCIGGDCDEFIGEEKVINKKNILKGREGEKQIERIITEEFLGCWNMMGEGKISLFSSAIQEKLGLSDKVYAGCVICSRIAFNEDNLPDSVELENVDPLEYMAKYKMPGKDVSYYEYLTKEKAQFKGKDDLIIPEPEDEDTEGLDDNLDKIEENLDDIGELDDPGNVESDERETKEIAIVFQQISEVEGRWGSLKNLGIAAAAVGGSGHFLTSGLTTKAGAAVGGKILAAIGIATVGVQQLYAVPGQENFAAGYCGDISYGSDAYNGCSSVRLVNYNINDIKKTCPVIESIP